MKQISKNFFKIIDEILESAFLVNLVNVGDVVSLPKFTVPAATIDGERKMDFEKHTIKDNAVVYNITEKYIYLVFEHCLFESAVDLNGQTEWKKTQLYQYLHKTFAKAMNNAGIDARKVNLLSEKEVYGNKEEEIEPLPYFRYVKNRIATTLSEDYSHSYWLSASSSYFCYSGIYGNSYSDDASGAYIFVRPRFALKIGE